MVDIKIEEQITASVRSSIESYLQSVDLDKIIGETLQQQIGIVMGNLTNRVLGQMLKDRDLPGEVNLIVKNLLNDHLMELGQKSVLEVIRKSDFNKLIVSSVQNEVHRVAGSYEFPENSIPFSSINLEGFSIPAQKLDKSKVPSLNSTGLVDISKSTQITLTDDGVVVTNNITSENLLVADNAFTKNLMVEGDFTVTGNVLDSQPLNQYVTKVSNATTTNILNDRDKKDIDLTGRSLVADGKVIITENSLGPQIVSSNLRKVGNLTELVVTGQAIIDETLIVNNNQVGINTEEPRGALTVWDEDSEMSFVKVAPKRMFAGSTRLTDVSLGTNNLEQLLLKTNGEIEIIGPIRFNGVLVNVVDKIPERVGEPGEIAVLRNSSAIYRCVGQTRWEKIV